ncbi:hypothetical protein P3L10_003733 [Capsicum annuum]
MEEVQIISTCLVGATSNESFSTPKNISKVEMTPWDLQFLLLDNIQKGLLFYKPKTENTNNNSLVTKSSLINHIKTSLSHTLHFFPLLSGRFSAVKKTKDNTVSFFINCNNAGVEFIHANAPSLTVSTILSSSTTITLFPLNNVQNFECVTKPLWGSNNRIG